MTDTPSPTAAAPGAAMDRRIARAPKRRWRLPAIAVAIALAAFLAWRWLPAANSTNLAAADVETGAVTHAPFEDFLPVRASVAPRVTTFVSAIAGGAVQKLLVQDGASVTAGEALATLANPTLTLDILTREATIASQLGAVSGDDLALQRGRLDRASQTTTAGYDLIKAQRDFSVQRQLHDQGFVSDAGVDSAREQADYQKRRLAQLRGGERAEEGTAAIQAGRLAQTRARLDGTLKAVQASLDALTVRAPVSGRLTNFTIQPGQSLKPGDQAGQIDSEGQWKLVADVDEYYLGRVRVGQHAVGNDRTALIVTKVLPTVTDGRFRIELGFAGATPAGLNRGQTTDVRVTLGATRAAVVAPVGGWLDAGGGNSVFVLDASGHHATRRAVRVGARNSEQAEILSGLQPGDRIITSATPSVKTDIINIR